jgi:hypothetical protein
MEIKYLGDKTIFLKGKKESVLIDSTENSFSDSKYGARVVLYTNENERKADLLDDRVLINGPGEYEIGGVEINGINGDDGNTVYKITLDGFKLVVIGELKQELSEKRVERIEDTDILLISSKVSGIFGYKVVKDWAKKWGANYLIPVSDDQEMLKKFLDEADNEGLEAVESLKLEKVDDLPDGLEIKLLKSLK